MISTQTADLYRDVLTSVERLDTSRVVLPSRLGKKPFAPYRKSNAQNPFRIDDSSDHAGAPFDYSSHTNLEVVFGVSGRAELAMAGQRYALAEGEMAFVPPGVPHLERILSRRQSYHLIWLNVKPEQLFIHSSL